MSIKNIVHQTIRTIPNTITEQEAGLFNSFPVMPVSLALQEVIVNEPNSTIVSRALDALLKLENFDQVDYLISSLNNTQSIDWRLVLCRKLTQFKDQKAIKKLCSIVLNDPSPDIRFYVADSLGTIGDEYTLHVLEQVAQNDTGVDYEGVSIASVAAKSIQQIKNRLLL